MDIKNKYYRQQWLKFVACVPIAIGVQTNHNGEPWPKVVVVLKKLYLMVKNLLTLFVILIVLSCKEDGLKYDEIDFETRKIVLSSWWTDFDNLVIKRRSETEKKLYQFYESEIKKYQTDLIKNMEILDSLNNHEETWLANIEKWQKERQEKASESEKNDINIFYPTVEEEFEDIVMLNKYNRETNKRELDSITQIYHKTPQTETYHEIEYQLSGYSKMEKSDLVQNLKVWVHDDSKIFKYLFLGLPQKPEQ